MDPTEAAAALAASSTPPPPADDDVTDVGAALDNLAPSAVVEAQSPADTLSPAVRRLIRQYDLDVTGVHGTGPDGRIRVGDVIGMLGSRATEPPPRLTEPVRHAAADADAGAAEHDQDAAAEPYANAHKAAESPTTAQAPAATPTSTVFECDLSRVLSHRKRQRGNNVELLLTSYFLVACAEAQKTAPELTDRRAACFGVQLTTADGVLHSMLVATDSATTASHDERLRAIDAKLRAGATVDFTTANVLVHHYGASGSLMATPTPIGAEHAGSIGIGRVRREIVVRTTDDGEEAPRVSARCYVSLSFLPERIALHRANHFMAHAVHILEQWPE